MYLMGEKAKSIQLIAQATELLLMIHYTPCVGFISDTFSGYCGQVFCSLVSRRLVILETRDILVLL